VTNTGELFVSPELLLVVVSVAGGRQSAMLCTAGEVLGHAGGRLWQQTGHDGDVLVVLAGRGTDIDTSRQKHLININKNKLSQPFDAHCCHMGTAIKHPVLARLG